MANERPLTLAEARSLLYMHATDDPADGNGTFLLRLNEALERISSDGVWDGAIVRTDVSGMITDHILTLPYEWSAAIAIAIEESGRPIMSEEHEFTQGGPGVQEAGEGGSMVVDLGFNEVSGELVRQYKILTTLNPGDEVEALLKRRFTHLVDDTDVVRPSNLGALKHALLAICFENEGDPARSKAYWDQCYEILNSEKETHNIGVTRTRPTNPWGFNTDAPSSFL